jgi:hypothetical protein
LLILAARAARLVAPYINLTVCRHAALVTWDMEMAVQEGD